MKKFNLALLIFLVTLILSSCGKNNEGTAVNEQVFENKNIDGENDHEAFPEKNFQSKNESFKKIHTEPKLSITSTTYTALKNDGSLYGWGYNYSGQIGNGIAYNLEYEKTPIYLQDLNGFTSVLSLAHSTLALKEDGTVWGWGENKFGQLCDGTVEELRLNPVQAQGIDNVAAITGVDYTVLALKKDGTVWMWGDNEFGFEFKEDYSCIPVQVPNIDDAVAVSSSRKQHFALKADGTVWTWGESIKYPEQVQGIDNVIAIDVSISGSHTLALKADGTVWGWGNNKNLYGNTEYLAGTTSVPTQIPNLIGIKKVVTDIYGNFALKEDGTVWSWGWNLYGSLGERNTDNQTPGQILNFGDVADIDADFGVVMAVKEDGTVWGWGNNDDGRISEDVRNQYTQQVEEKITVPVQIQGINLIE